MAMKNPHNQPIRPSSPLAVRAQQRNNFIQLGDCMLLLLLWATCDLMQVAETLPEEVLSKMGAPPKKDHPIADYHKLNEYDGVIFGVPGRFGTMPAQIKVRNEDTTK